MLENYLEVSFLTFDEKDKQEAITNIVLVKHPTHLGLISHESRSNEIQSHAGEYLRAAIVQLVKRQRRLLWKNLTSHPHLNVAIRPAMKNPLPWTPLRLDIATLEVFGLDHFFRLTQDGQC